MGVGAGLQCARVRSGEVVGVEGGGYHVLHHGELHLALRHPVHLLEDLEESWGRGKGGCLVHLLEGFVRNLAVIKWRGGGGVVVGNGGGGGGGGCKWWWLLL